MWIIKITANENGSHDAQTWPIEAALPNDHAVGNPDEYENFPFGDITVEEINGVPTVTSWTPGTMPEPEPILEPEPTAEDDLSSLLIDQEYRLTLLELGL